MTYPPFAWPPIASGNNAAAPTAAIVGADIAPLHWWLASQVTISGGLVDSLNDQGSSPLNFTQVGAARAPIVVDANGNPYLALDGVADFYQSGLISSYNYLHNGSPFTVAMVIDRTALITANEVLIDNCNFSSGGTGIALFQSFTSATVQGIRNFVANGSAGLSPIGTTSLVPYTAITMIVLRFNGDNTNATSGTGNTTLPIDMVLRRRGQLVATSARNANAFSVLNATQVLTLGRQSNAAAAFSAARRYEMIIDNKAWSDRQVALYEDYARNLYRIAA